ncbi:MAG: hypothetical protein V1816_20565 [Pseudomonadota bacterium]
MENKALEILKTMARELPGLTAAAVVHLEDGLSIAEVSTRDDVDAGAASAYLASIVQSNLQAVKVLAADQITHDILITTDKNYFLIRHFPRQPFFLFVMTEKDEWLGRARLIMKTFERLLIKALA